MINFAHKSRLVSVFEIICNVYSIIWWSVHTTYWNKSIMKISHVLGKARSIFFMMTHILLFFFSFGKKGLVLTFIKIKANLFLPLAYQKGIQNLQSQLYIIWLKSILVLLNHFIINDDLYKYKYICKGHALINILHFTHKYAFVNLPEGDYLKKPSRSCYEWSRIFIFRCDISNRDC